MNGGCVIDAPGRRQGVGLQVHSGHVTRPGASAALTLVTYAVPNRALRLIGTQTKIFKVLTGANHRVLDLPPGDAA